MRMLPGSHLSPPMPHVDTYAEHNLLTRGQVIDVDIDETMAVDVVLTPSPKGARGLAFWCGCPFMGPDKAGLDESSNYEITTYAKLA